ncbi:Cytochrome P450 3A13 [Atta colombica]|uniref:Cytochrome P450 3A13 n=1 Tax=Atta colombica TaxID=520822 RepID=A0A195BFQ2_9HYME|nr:Cytochrome P450 3A13 [Atta colombica]
MRNVTEVTLFVVLQLSLYFLNILNICTSELIDCIDAVIKKYGNLTRVIVGTDIFIVLTKPEDYKLVLTNVNGNYKSSVTQTWEAILGDGIIRASVTTVGIQGIAHKDERDILHKQKEYISPRKPGNYTALQYNNYNMTIIQELKPIFYNYYDRVEQIRVNASNKSYDIQNTITEATSFTMLMLAIHTDVQEKLRQEILVTFNNDKIDVQRLLSMRYLYMVFQETLRLFPVVPLISRQLTGDIKLESCTLPEGCYVMIPIFAIHRNPMYWYKPLEFIPERFSSTRHRYTYIPFGMGLRDCIGQKYAFLFMATIIVNLLRRFRFVTVGNLNDVKTTTDIVLRLQHVKMSIFRI